MRRTSSASAALFTALLAAACAGCGSDADKSEVTALSVEGTLTVRGAVHPDRVIAVATDGDAPTDDGPLWFVERAGPSQLAVRRVQLGERGARVHPVVLIDGVSELGGVTPIRARGPRDERVQFDVARWQPGDGAPYLFSMAKRASRVNVAVRSLADGGRVAGGRALLAPAPGGVSRALGIATWSGSRPDLFVLDRGSKRERLQLSVFSGESAFTRPIIRLKLPYRGLEAREAGVDVGRVTQPQPDLVTTPREIRRRDVGASLASAQVHVISGEHNFQRFSYQRALDVRSPLSDCYLLVFGVTRGIESLIAVDLCGRRARLGPIRLFEPVGEL